MFHSTTVALVAVVLAVSVSSITVAGSAQGQAGDIAAVSIDMDPAGNTATSLGPRDECREALPGATLDIDITIEAVSPANPMVGYSFALTFPGPTITVTGRKQLMIGAAEGSDPFDVSEPPPQFDGNWNVDIFDFGDPTTTAETGDGVLVRATLEVSTDAPPAAYVLELARPLTLDLDNTEHHASIINNSRLAIGVSCAGSTPLPPVIIGLQTDVPTSPPDGGTASPRGSTTSTQTSSPADDDSSLSSSPFPSSASNVVGESPSAAQSSPDDESRDDGSNQALLLLGVTLIIIATIGAGWFAYRRYSSAE